MPKDSRSSNGGFFGSFFQEKTYLGFFVLLRFFIGFSFLKAGWMKYGMGFLNPHGKTPLTGILNQWLAGPPAMPDGWYRGFIENIVIPNAHTFGILVALGELGVGACLIIGLATRPVAALGAFMCASYYLATAHLPTSTAMLNETFVVVNVLLAAAAAGRAWGVDYYLRRAWPKMPLW